MDGLRIHLRINLLTIFICSKLDEMPFLPSRASLVLSLPSTTWVVDCPTQPTQHGRSRSSWIVGSPTQPLRRQPPLDALHLEVIGYTSTTPARRLPLRTPSGRWSTSSLIGPTLLLSLAWQLTSASSRYPCMTPSTLATARRTQWRS